MEATAKAMGIEEVVTAPQSPWQNAYVERFVGSVRRECLDHVIVFNKAGLLRLMTLYRAYYERSRTHLSLDNDAPIPRLVATARDGAAVVAIPEVGGLHHRYERGLKRPSLSRLAPRQHERLLPSSILLHVCYRPTIWDGRRAPAQLACTDVSKEHAEHFCRVRVHIHARDVLNDRQIDRSTFW